MFHRNGMLWQQQSILHVPFICFCFLHVSVHKLPPFFMPAAICQLHAHSASKMYFNFVYLWFACSLICSLTLLVSETVFTPISPSLNNYLYTYNLCGKETFFLLRMAKRRWKLIQEHACTLIWFILNVQSPRLLLCAKIFPTSRY